MIIVLKGVEDTGELERAVLVGCRGAKSPIQGQMGGGEMMSQETTHSQSAFVNEHSSFILSRSCISFQFIKTRSQLLEWIGNSIFDKLGHVTPSLHCRL